MREIKFRAWVPRQKGFREYYNDKGKTEKMHHNTDHIGTVEASFDQRDGETYFEDTIAMQFTGRKSEDGVEIYEGDIVNHGDNYPSEVVFVDYAWQLKEYGYGADGHGVGTNSRWHSFLSYTNPMKVLGNIHENPELLGVCK